MSEDGTPSIDVDESNATNEVVLTAIHENTTNSFLTLQPRETVELNAFIIPQTDVAIGDGWYIEVQYNNGDKYQLSLAGTATSGKTMTLTAGRIHRLPSFPALKDPSAWNGENWMTNVARNVYLSELSIPGSWNTLNSDFQVTDDDDTSIAAQWNLGCRAFHFDTRWRTNNSPAGLGTFVEESNLTVDALSVADGSDTYNYGTNGGRVMIPSTSSFLDRLKQVAEHVKEKPEEYAVVLCSFAQGSYPDASDTNKGRTPSYGDMKGKTWMQAISEACEDENVADYIYDARNLTPNTVVGDVQGKIIVIVCCDYEISNLTLPTNSKCLFTYSPNTLKKTDFQNAYNDSELYYGTTKSSGLSFRSAKAQITATDDSELDSDDLGFEDGSGDKRGYAPTIATRKTQLENILTWSEGNFADPEYDHSHWVLLGLGGYMYKHTTYWLFVTRHSYSTPSGAYTSVASTLNDWIAAKLTAMESNKNYYPVGIVLMNFVNNYSSTVEDIYQLNTKYQMSHDPNYTSTSTSSVKAHTQATYTSGGNAISH